MQEKGSSGKLGLLQLVTWLDMEAIISESRAIKERFFVLKMSLFKVKIRICNLTSESIMKTHCVIGSKGMSKRSLFNRASVLLPSVPGTSAVSTSGRGKWQAS